MAGMRRTAIGIGTDKVIDKVKESITPDMPEPPQVDAEKTKVMPLPDDEARAKARRRTYASLRARSGRDSTIMSQETLG